MNSALATARFSAAFNFLSDFSKQ
eukprot:COSAG02_NODE_60336_length_271_cov_1.197674_1_plen_23_part_10